MMVCIKAEVHREGELGQKKRKNNSQTASLSIPSCR